MIGFLDGGAHNGESIALWRSMHGDGPIIAVEPNPIFARPLRDLGARHVLGALGPGGIVPLYLGARTAGSTIVAAKTSGDLDRDHPLYVPTVTLAAVLGLFPADLDVAVKLDIEGAEYDVLEDALHLGSLDRVRELYVDFHADRIEGFPPARHNALVRELLARGYPLPKWSPNTGRVAPHGEAWLLAESP